MQTERKKDRQAGSVGYIEADTDRERERGSDGV